MNSLLKILRRRFGVSGSGGTAIFGKKGGVNIGFETVIPSDHYKWHGMRRGVEKARPQLLFQYTLEGWGRFHNGTTWAAVPEAHAFTARFPSRHTYTGDSACPSWTFLWIIVSQPYVVGRLLEQRNLVNAIAPLVEDSPVVQAASELLLHISNKGEPSMAEEILFRWMFEMERAAFSLRHPAKERAQILDFVRDKVTSQLNGFIAVEDLAARWGTSRSNFTHYFSNVAGTTPAAYIMEVRLGEAARLLRLGQLSVKEVAARTGFSGPNHLCKAFRAQHQISPGAYQKLYKTSSPATPLRRES